MFNKQIEGISVTNAVIFKSYVLDELSVAKEMEENMNGNENIEQNGFHSFATRLVNAAEQREGGKNPHDKNITKINNRNRKKDSSKKIQFDGIELEEISLTSSSTENKKNNNKNNNAH